MLKADETTREDFLKDFWPALHANATVDGELYGVPFHNSTPLLYYNVEHFKDGVLRSFPLPRTWAEMVDAATQLRGVTSCGWAISSKLVPAGMVLEVGRQRDQVVIGLQVGIDAQRLAVARRCGQRQREITAIFIRPGFESW